MNDSKFNWIPFYHEVAEKLLAYKKNRKSLLEWIYGAIDGTFTTYLHESDGSHLNDIDPFTVFGIFNRGITDENRILIASQFKSFFSIQADVPNSFAGIPVLDNRKSHFFGFREHRADNDIDNLWDLFEKALTMPYEIEPIFNTVRKQFIVNVNITMGLYWILPESFIALDSRNRNYLLRKYGVSIKAKLPEYKQYTAIVQDILARMKNGSIQEKNFPELSYNAWLDSGGIDTENDDWRNTITELWRFKRNIILQGAPGSGKTYEVAELVVRLCNRLQSLDRESIVEEYKKLEEEGRVVFTTFHQSMDYEDFVEGLKPEVVDDHIHYTVTDGIFKQLCKNAQVPVVHDPELEIGSNPTIWKVSLKSTYDNPVRTDCLTNGRIRIGWDGYGENISEDTQYDDGGRIVLDAFINKMQIGDIVMSCYSNQIVDAIGVITGDYVWNDALSEYKRTRAVKWFVKNIRENIYELNNHTAMTLSTVYRLSNISLEDVVGLLEKYNVITHSTVSKNEEPYILIIDEINRGNVSKIFGELITLLEPDKRVGAESQLSVKLPYSKEKFRVPSNIYILATMNTADRSLGTLDYAIRRRFAFVSTNPYKLDEEGFNEKLFAKVSNLFVSNYASCSNGEERPMPSKYLSEEFDPADVWIGHSYFLMRDKEGIDRTRYRLTYEIIPMLWEYLKDGIFKDSDAVKQIIHELQEGIDYD